MNKSFLIGRLAADPEPKKTNSGISVTRFTLAVDRPYQKDKEKETDWIDIVAWRNTAEFICKHFYKGSPIVVEGSIETKMWEDKHGQKRKTVDIVADNVEFAPINKGLLIEAAPATPTAEPPVYTTEGAEDFTVVDDEDLPF